jgi:RsiW-degrading membrane proteinase PrsW (M82 family)
MMQRSASERSCDVVEPRLRGTTSAPVRRSTRWPGVYAGAGAVLAAAALAAWVADQLSAGVAATIVLTGAAIGLRGVYAYTVRSATSPSATGTTSLVSTIGLAVSVLTVIGTVPHITKTAGLGTFTTDLMAQLWTLAILTAVAAPVRTLGWRPLAGASLTGFLASTGMARLVARPVVVALGQSSLMATAVWVPLTEELFKALPLIFVAVTALRRTSARPSALDLMLLGAWTGAGFALYENAVLGRGGFDLAAAPVLSLVFPSETAGRAVGWTVVQTGHLVHTALIGLGLGVALFYRTRVPRAWIAAAVAVGAALLEHMGQNALALGHVNATVGQIMLGLTLGGRLSSILLLGGVAGVVAVEWRSIGGAMRPELWAILPLAEARRRASRLAKAQLTMGAI